MRDRRHAAALILSFAVAACGDDTTDGSGGSGATSGGPSTSSASTTSAGTTSASTTSASSASATGASTGGGDQGGGGEGGGGVGGAGGAGSGGTELAFEPLWQDVAYPDDGGRLDLQSFVGVTLQVRAAGTGEVLLELPNQTLPAGIIVHAYAVGLVADDTLDAFVVQDNDELEAPAPGEGNIRLAHFAPDVPAVDVYLIDEDFTVYGPVLEAFDYPNMSRYGSFPAGVYEARIVPAGDGPFDPGFAIVSGLQIDVGRSATFAIVGLDGAASVDVVAFEDDVALPADGTAAVTFVHAAPDAPAVDVGALLPVE